MSEGVIRPIRHFFLEWVHHLIASDAAMGILQSQLDDAASILPTGGVDILLADEPTGNLDSKNALAVMGILQSLNEEGTIICMVTHDERFAKAAGREIGLLDGKVL